MSLQIKMNDGDAVLILEPANIRLMKDGKPVTVDLARFGGSGTLRIYFTPDLPRLQAEFKIENRKKIVLTSEEVDQIIVDSKEWRELDRAAN